MKNNQMVRWSKALRFKCCACVLAGVLLTGLASTGNAQGAYGPIAGDWELTLGGGGTSANDFDANSLNFNGSLGKYLTDNWEVSLRQGIGYDDVGGTSNWRGSTRGAIDYNFDLDRARPFLGANFGGQYGDGIRDTFLAGLETGLKYYVKPQTFVFGLVEYQWLFNDADDIEDTFDGGAFAYTVGIGFNF